MLLQSVERGGRPRLQLGVRAQRDAYGSTHSRIAQARRIACGEDAIDVAQRQRTVGEQRREVEVAEVADADRRQRPRARHVQEVFDQRVAGRPLARHRHEVGQVTESEIGRMCGDGGWGRGRGPPQRARDQGGVEVAALQRHAAGVQQPGGVHRDFDGQRWRWPRQLAPGERVGSAQARGDLRRHRARRGEAAHAVDLDAAVGEQRGEETVEIGGRAHARPSNSSYACCTSRNRPVASLAAASPRCWCRSGWNFLASSRWRLRMSSAVACSSSPRISSARWRADTSTPARGASLRLPAGRVAAADERVLGVQEDPLGVHRVEAEAAGHRLQQLVLARVEAPVGERHEAAPEEQRLALRAAQQRAHAGGQ
jgi:hypothetical protein